MCIWKLDVTEGKLQTCQSCNKIFHNQPKKKPIYCSEQCKMSSKKINKVSNVK